MSPFLSKVLRAENGFPTQAYSLFTISALREAFSSKVTPAMRPSCTRLHPNAFDKDSDFISIPNLQNWTFTHRMIIPHLETILIFLNAGLLLAHNFHSLINLRDYCDSKFSYQPLKCSIYA